MKKGKLIVIEGGDGTGKATQTRLLAQRLLLEGYPVKTIDFPRKDSFFGKLIYEGLAGQYGDFKSLHPKLASVFWAADRYLASTQIEIWLDSGQVVIADRYVSANQLHQGGKISDETERREFLKWLDEMEHEEFKIPRPDIVFLLDLPFEISLELIKKRGVSDQHESDAAHQVAARESGIKMLSNSSWVQIACSKDGKTILAPEVIHEKIVPYCLELLSQKPV